jgi:hypothetical protein
MNSDDEIHINQGDAAESFVAGILQRRGFTINNAHKDRFGWDLLAERIERGASTKQSPMIAKFGLAVQVKSTRVSKSSVQVRLSALQRLVAFDAVCVIAFVSFRSGGDLPETISFIHVGKAVIDLVYRTHQELRLANKLHEDKWITISTDDAITVQVTTSDPVDLYSHFCDFRNEFDGHYALAKADYFKSLSDARVEAVSLEVPVGTSEVTFARGCLHTTLTATVHKIYCGPKISTELRNKFFTIRVERKNIAWFLDKEAPISELSAAVLAMDIVEDHGWSLDVRGTVTYADSFSFGSEVRTWDMREVSGLIAIYAKLCERREVDPVVHFAAIGGEWFADANFGDFVRYGGLLNAGEYTPSREVHVLTKALNIAGRLLSLSWTFKSISHGGSFYEVEPGMVSDACLFDDSASYEDYHERQRGASKINTNRICYVNGLRRDEVPRIHGYRITAR